MTDLYAPQRSALERRRIADGRRKLRHRLAHAPYSNGQSGAFALEERFFTETRGRRQYDVFTLRGRTDALSQCWRDDERRYDFVVGADSNCVSVPVDYYLRGYVLPFESDLGFVVRLALLSALGAAALYLRTWLPHATTTTT